MPMRRREKFVTGLVNFPVDSPDYENTKEGGMFVRVMVLETPQTEAWLDKTWMECCGGTQTVQMDESLLADEATEIKLFPCMFNGNGSRRRSPSVVDHGSVECLAAITIGSTGWTGFDHKAQCMWTCTEDDLNADGKALMAILRDTYPGQEIILTTWLDT